MSDDLEDEMEEVVDNLKKASVWQRALFTLGFALLFYMILVPLVLLSMLVQVVFWLFTGEANKKIAELSNLIVAFMREILRFLLFLSDKKPFPFSDFPEPDRCSSQGCCKEEEPEVAPSENAAVDSVPDAEPQAESESPAVEEEPASKAEPDPGNAKPPVAGPSSSATPQG